MSMATGGTVLLLEDDDSVREVLSLLLTDDGHDVLACTSAEEIVDRAAATPQALAVIDFWGSSHATLVARERMQLADLARSVPTVLVTARQWASAEVADELGLAGLVRMPFDVTELSDVVRGCMARVRTEGEGAPSPARESRAALRAGWGRLARALDERGE